jgi:hypothetical protein
MAPLFWLVDLCLKHSEIVPWLVAVTLLHLVGRLRGNFCCYCQARQERTQGCYALDLKQAGNWCRFDLPATFGKKGWSYEYWCAGSDSNGAMSKDFNITGYLLLYPRLYRRAQDQNVVLL